MKLLSALYKVIVWLILFTFPFSFIFPQQVWQQTNSEVDYPIYKFASLNDNLYAAFYGAGVFKTSDEGETWEICHNGLTNFLARDIVVAGNTLFVGTNRGGVFKSLNNGVTWTTANDEILHKDIWSLLAVNNRLFAGTAKGLFFTDDSGSTWQKATLPRPKAHHQIIFSLAAKGNQIIAGSNSYVYKSDDFGTTWQQIKVPTRLDVMTIQVQNGLWLLGTSGEGIISSKDGENWNSWNKESGNTRSLILVEDNVFLGSANNGILSVGSNLSVATVNEGFTNPSIRSVGYHNGKLYAGTYKQGIWRYDIPQPNFVPPSSPNLYKTVNIYPNPTSDGIVTLDYKLTENTKVQISLFDSFGKAIGSVLPQSEQYKGSHQISYNLKDLIGGTYYFQVQLGDEQITKQIVLIQN